MKKPLYLLMEKEFNQPSFGAFMSGFGVPDRLVDKTTSLTKAKKWSEKTSMNYYKIV